MELAHAIAAHSSHLLASEAAADVRGRSILEDLIRPIAGREAGAWAGQLIGHFGSAGAVLTAPREAVASITPGPAVADLLAAVRQLQVLTLHEEMAAQPVFSSAQSVRDYLRFQLEQEPEECLWVLYLNAANRLIVAEAGERGCVKRLSLYPRRIFKRALELGATALILAHNHPSGDPTPSKNDIAATQQFALAARTMEVELHDHLIVAGGRWCSLRALGVLS
jgi:DNA repair protein RadC